MPPLERTVLIRRHHARLRVPCRALLPQTGPTWRLQQNRKICPEKTPQNRRLGYARISTYSRNSLARSSTSSAPQDASLDLPRKGDGHAGDRRELLKLLKAIGHGDVVTVTRIDQLARSTFDLFAIINQIVGAKAQFRSLAEPWVYRK